MTILPRCGDSERSPLRSSPFSRCSDPRWHSFLPAYGAFDRDRWATPRRSAQRLAGAREMRSALSDEQLMRAAQTGDVRAFEEIYRRYRPRALGLARVICRGSIRADEATQDGFVSAWRFRHTYDPD